MTQLANIIMEHICMLRSRQKNGVKNAGMLNQKGFTLLEILIATGVVVISLGFAFNSYYGVDQSSKVTNVKQNIVSIVAAARKLKTSNTNSAQYRYQGQPITLTQLKNLNYLPVNFPVPTATDTINIQGVTYAISTGTSVGGTSPDIYLNVTASDLNGFCAVLIKSLNNFRVPTALVTNQIGTGVDSISCNATNSVFNIWFD